MNEELLTLKSTKDLMTEHSDPSDTNHTKLRHYMEDSEKHYNNLADAVKMIRQQLERALEKAKVFEVEFQKERLWLNGTEDQLIVSWNPHGLCDKCEEEIAQHKVRMYV